jgi:adenylosuccinate synthase
LFHPAAFRERLSRIVDYKNRLLAAMLADFEPFDAVAVAEEYLEHAEQLRPYVRDTTAWLHQALGQGKRLLFEGAQGSLLDVDHGSYPYVTSSNSSAAGIAAGSGVPTRHISRWIGIVKAYTTRVGGGPFPTEQDNATGERIRRVGREYGTVTNRPRRCGWFDAVAVRYSARISGATELAIMLLDVLSGLEELQVAIAYEMNGKKITELPASLSDFELCQPVYQTLPGWADDLTGIRRWSDLPEAARNYVEFVAQQVGVRASIVSVGPDRRQTILVPSGNSG